MARNNLVKLNEILSFLGIDPDTSSFDSRMKIQKVTYILKSMGIDLEYPFEFYEHGHGVYSRELAWDYYHSAERLTYEKLLCDKEDSLNEKEKIKLDQFKKVDFHNLKMLEAISSIIYLNLTYGYQEDVVERIKRIKPHLGHDLTLMAQNNAKTLLFEESYLTEEIKEELESWDALNDTSNS